METLHIPVVLNTGESDQRTILGYQLGPWAIFDMVWSTEKAKTEFAWLVCSQGSGRGLELLAIGFVVLR